MAYTSPRTWVSLETPTSAIFNTHVRDNQLYTHGTDGDTKSGLQKIELLTAAVKALQFSATGSVAHGVTTHADTAAFGYMQQVINGTGGLAIEGLAEAAAEAGLYLSAIAGADATGKLSN